MIPKRINVGSWDNQIGWQTATLVDPVRGKFFKEAFLEKEASMFDELIQGVTPEKGKSYLHVISLGSLEKYGANSNGDAFNMTYRDFRIPSPKEGVEEIIKLGGGLEKYHDSTFKKEGAVYKNHKNGLKKGKPSGKVIDACINPKMQRGELLLEVDNDVWSKELEKLASGDNVYLSMGCLVPTDCCSICGNRAASREEYCEHLTNHMGQLDKEGNAVFAINDKQTFHDISGVLVPADKIACGLRFVKGMEKAASLNELIVAPTPSIRVFGYKGEPADALSKLAKMEKKILVIANKDLASGRPMDLPGDLISELGSHPLEDVFTALRGNNCMLSPKSFFELVLGPRFKDAEDDVKCIDERLPGVYSRIEGGSPSDLIDFLEDGSYEPNGKRPVRLEITIKRAIPLCSIEPAQVAARAADRSLSDDDSDEEGAEKGKSEKEASAGADLLAREYARYQMSFLGNIPKEAEAIIATSNNTVSTLCR